MFREEVLSNLTNIGVNKTCRIFHGRGGVFSGWENLNVDFYDGLFFIVLYGDDEFFFDKLNVAMDLLFNDKLFLEKVKRVRLQHRFSSNYKYIENKLNCINKIKELENNFTKRTKYLEKIDKSVFHIGSENGILYMLILDGPSNPGLFTSS